MLNPRHYVTPVTSSQPTVFPKINLVHRMSIAKFLILVEEAQYNSYHTQYYIVNHNGLCKLSLPVKDKRMKPFNKLYPANINKWKKNLLNNIDMSYKKTVGYNDKEFLDSFKGMVGNWDQLSTICDMGEDIFSWLCTVLDFNCEIIGSTELLPNNTLKSSEWIGGLAKQIGADLYFQGKNSMDSYFNKDNFEGVTLAYQDAKFKPYTNVDRKEHDLANICIIDPLFVLGVDGTKNLIAQAGKGLYEWVD